MNNSCNVGGSIFGWRLHNPRDGSIDLDRRTAVAILVEPVRPESCSELLPRQGYIIQGDGCIDLDRPTAIARLAEPVGLESCSSATARTGSIIEGDGFTYLD